MIPLNRLLLTSTSLVLAGLSGVSAAAVGQFQIGSSAVCLEAVGTPGNGVKLQSNVCDTSSKAQNWAFSQGAMRRNTLLGTSDGAYCIDVPNGEGFNGAELQLWSCDRNNRNQWFNWDDSNLRWGNSQYCADLADAMSKNFAKGLSLQLWECELTTPNQRFLGPAVVKLAATESTVTATSTVTVYESTSASSKTTAAPETTRKSSSTSSSKSSSKVTSAKSSLTTSKSKSSTTTSSSKASTSTSSSSNGQKPDLRSFFKPEAKRMLAWGYDDRMATTISTGDKISTYHHWENLKVKQMNPKVTYIPTYWGHSKKAQWEAVKAELGSEIPKAVAGFNEPDLPGQANMDPWTAAQSFYEDIDLVYGRKGANTIAPAVAWNVDGWLVPFLNRCEQLGCQIDAVGFHIYLDLNNDIDAAVAEVKRRINWVYSRANKPIVLSELGLTQSGGGSQSQMDEFVTKVGKYLESDDRILAWALSAVFAYGAGWDGYLNSQLAFFNTDGSLRPLAWKYMSESF